MIFSGIRRLNRKTVVVHLLSGQSLQGVLAATYRDCVVLRHVAVLDKKAVQLEGELTIPKDRIDFFQTVSA